MTEEERNAGSGTEAGTQRDYRFYFQDELGSPIRFADAEGDLTETYGYGVFGEDLYRNQGEVQPFGYTGYQKDEVARTYFAQAREYLPEVGRFGGEDIIRGTLTRTFTLNHYGYCWNNPLNLVDSDGLNPNKQYDYQMETDSNGIALIEDTNTIICGNNATIYDAYALITLDRMAYLGYDKDEIEDFINRYREKNPDTVIEEGKDITYYSYQEDITHKLDSFMIKNEYENRPELPMICIMEFKNKVGNNKEWDLKQQSDWSSNSSMYYYNGELVDKDALGNIMYGYMGKVYGIPDVVLYLGAGYAQVMAGTSKRGWLLGGGDDPIDQMNVSRGIQRYNYYHSGIGGED